MPVLVEARRPDRNRFFGVTLGWFVEREDDPVKYNPGDDIDYGVATLVFEDDEYKTKFRIPQIQGEERIWLKCEDGKTLIHVSLGSETPVEILMAGDGRVEETHRRKKFLTAHLSSSFRMDPSPYRKAVLRVSIGTVVFLTNEWYPQLEEADSLQLTVSFRDSEPQTILARTQSELLSPSKDFTTFSQSLSVSLLKISDQYSRVISVDPQGEGYAQGIREGDLLVSQPDATDGLRRWRRLETRQIVFDRDCEFDFENEEDEDEDGERGGATSKQLMTFSMRLVPSQDSVAPDISLEPLEYLFGSDPLMQDDNGVGNSQWSFDVDATNMKVDNEKEQQSNYLRIISPSFELAHERISPSHVLSLRISFRASVGISLVSTDAVGSHSDLALMSLRNIQVKTDFMADGGMFIEAQAKAFQVDDQQPEAAYPVAIFPTPLADNAIDPDAPSLRATISMRSPDPALISIRYLELFLTETSLKIHESFLIGLAEFVREVRNAVAETALEPREVTSEDGMIPMNNKIRAREEEAEEAAPISSKNRRVYIDEADLKPMRFNITFTSSASVEEKSLRVRLRQLPVFAALITAVAAVSDAPLRLGAVRLERESKTVEGFVGNLMRHYSSEIIRGVLTIAGSTDLLGSPVHLLGSVGQGAFSFFYEPALALSLGYGQLGRGIQRGGTELIGRSAGGLLDSVAKMTSAVSKAIAQSSGDERFVQRLTQRMKPESYLEPINVREGVSSGLLVLVRCLIDSIAGFVQIGRQRGVRRRRRTAYEMLLRPLMGLLLKPAAGFFAALNQISTGIRNVIVSDRLRNCFPLRLPRPREAQILPYSSSRSAGYLLARHRFGRTVQFVMNDICQLEIRLVEGSDVEEPLKHTLVATVVVTACWIVACRETLLDAWAIPLDLVENVRTNEPRRLLLSCLGKEYTIVCRTREDMVALDCSFEFAKKLRSGQVKSFETFSAATPRKHKPSLRASALWDVRSSRGSLRQLKFGDEERLIVGGGNELDVAGCQFHSAEIQSYGEWPDGVYRYHVKLVSIDLRVEWTVERRYSEFLKFRDQACKFLSVSRRSMPLPGRRPWTLSAVEHEERRKGLQTMLDMCLKIDLLAESEVLREFLTRGADNVVIRD